MTQPQFAEWIGVSESAIALVEAGHRKPSPHIIGKVAKKFDVSDDDFLEFLDRKQKAAAYNA